ncbi:MAG: MarR family transcriptional regulator [Gammaproteobacteria bacterium]|nr:MarR family transcriptional regulator [Gammaproteobacteria bacterium]
MMGYFVVHGGTHSFSELAERLQVSRGSVSTNARLLEGLGILEKTAKPGDRQDYFRLSDDPYGRLLKGYLQRMESSRHLVSQTINDLPAKDGSIERLKDMQQFYEITLASTQAGLETWSKTRK